MPGSGVDGRADLPAEHGFRFFPGFYRHMPDTMSRIPTADGTVLDRLTAATRVMIAQERWPNEIDQHGAPSGVTRRPRDRSAGSCSSGRRRSGIPAAEQAVLIERLLTLLTSCDERRYEQWEQQSWWEFVGAERRSVAFRKFLADGLTRTLVAARAREISARTGGLILAQLLFDMTRVGGRADRVLDGPTNEAWIDPWVEHLRRARCRPAPRLPGAGSRRRWRAHRRRHHARPARSLPTSTSRRCPSRSCGRWPGRRAPARAPVGRPRPSRHPLDERRALLPRPDVPIVHGHTIYIDSEWALTSISQAQFWRRRRRRALRRRERSRHPVRRRIRLGHPGAAHRQGGIALHPRGDPRRGVGPAHRSSQRRSATRPRRVTSAGLVPRSGDRVPQPDRGGQPRAAPDQHRRIVERPARGDDADRRT